MLLNDLPKADVGELLSYNGTLPPSLWIDFALKDDQSVDIISTESRSNFNWTNFSDIDLHILLDYDVAPEIRAKALTTDKDLSLENKQR